jgi:hypothetical protein
MLKHRIQAHVRQLFPLGSYYYNAAAATANTTTSTNYDKITAIIVCHSKLLSLLSNGHRGLFPRG